MLRKLWQCTGKKQSDRSFCLILKAVGVLLAIAGIGCLAIYAVTLNGDCVLLGMSSFASGATSFCMAQFIDK